MFGWDSNDYGFGGLYQGVVEHHYHDPGPARLSWPFLHRLRLKLFPSWKRIYFFAVFSLLAKLAKSDGHITDSEILTAEEFMRRELRLDVRQRKLAFQIMTAARSSPYSFEQLASGYYKLFCWKRGMLENMVDTLLAIAYSDGNFSIEEQKLVKMTVEIFGLREKDYQRILSRFRDRGAQETEGSRSTGEYFRASQSQAHERPAYSEGAYASSEESRRYAILGCKPDDRIEIIKKRYRKLAMECHPDRLQTKGMSAEFHKIATERFLAIKEAYEWIIAERK